MTGQLEFAVNRSVSSPRGVGVGRPDGAQAEHELSEKEGPKCDCDGDISAVQRVSNTAKNPNRAFWVCSKGRDAVDKCGYFKWDDEIAVSGKRNDGFPMRFEDGGAAKRPRTGPRPGSGGSGSKVVSLALEEINAMSALVEPGTMSPDLEAALRELPGVTVVATPRARAFTAGNSSKYIIPFSVLDDSKRLCRTHGVSLESGVPPTVISRLQAFQQVEAHRKVTRKVITQGLDEILPAEMCEKLMEFQWEGIHFALSRGGRCLIGDGTCTTSNMLNELESSFSALWGELTMPTHVCVSIPACSFSRFADILFCFFLFLGRVIQTWVSVRLCKPLQLPAFIATIGLCSLSARARSD